MTDELKDSYVLPASFNYAKALQMLQAVFGYTKTGDFDDDEELELIERLHEVTARQRMEFWSNWDQFRYAPATLEQAQLNLPKLLAVLNAYLVEAEIFDNEMPLLDLLSNENLLNIAPRTKEEILAEIGDPDEDDERYEFPNAEIGCGDCPLGEQCPARAEAEQQEFPEHTMPHAA